MKIGVGFFAAVLMAAFTALFVAAQNSSDSTDAVTVPMVVESDVEHRPLRTNQKSAQPPSPTEPVTFDGYADALSFSVVPREPELSFYPCAQCHQHMPPNPTPRKLVAAPHPAALDHGEGRMWCVDCHSLDDRNHLRTIQDTPVSFNESDRLCGQCHAQRQKDWAYGGHGKRVAGWGSDRTIYACTHCHDPHSPGIKPRAPSAPPPVRAGLEPMPDVTHHHLKVWEQKTLQAHDAHASEEPGDEQ